MSTIANAKVAHNYNRYNGYFFGCLQLMNKSCFSRASAREQLGPDSFSLIFA